MRKTHPKACYRVTVGSGNLKQQIKGGSLLMYTVLTFLIVWIVYVITKDWKGFTAPEEVDLGAVTVPLRSYRRKHCQHERRRRDRQYE